MRAARGERLFLAGEMETIRFVYSCLARTAVLARRVRLLTPSVAGSEWMN